MDKQKLEITKEGFFLNGDRFYLASGDMHYFRIHPSGWRRRLELMKDFGLTAVETYVPWNCHEPKEGEFNFEGIYDLGAFLSLCAEMDFKVLLRPSPYICAEFEFGGVPSWLLKDRSMTIRANDERWLGAVKRYYKVLCDLFRPYLSTNGGPIIMVAVENEYGFRGNDRKYMNTLKDILTENGIDVPFFTTDPYEPAGLVNGSLDGILAGVNFRSLPGEPQIGFDMVNKYHPGFPYYVGEFWAGRQIHWGETYKKRDSEPTAQSYREALKLGYVNFYMFCGGTNFGFLNGAIIGRPADVPEDAPLKYTPQSTSYDENSLVSENGEPTQSYFLCRDVLDEFLGKPKREHIAPAYESQEITVQLTEQALLWDNIEALALTHTVESAPKYMEDLGQDYGYILYRVSFDRIEDMPEITFRADGIKDYAAVYQNGEYIDYWFRDRKSAQTTVNVNSDKVFMDVLAENLGRVNSGYNLSNNRKGVEGFLAVDWSELHEIETVTLPMKDLSVVKYNKLNGDMPKNTPVFLKGYFDAKAGVDTFFSIDGFNHGFVMVNGFNIGRYLPCGPQRTLYIPGGLLKDKGNVIEVFDLFPESTEVKLVSKAQLEMDIAYQDSDNGASPARKLAYDGT